MIRVAYLAQGLRMGGAERQLLFLLQSLDRKRFAPALAVFSKNGELQTAYEATGVPTIDLDLQFPLLRARNLSPLLQFLRWIRQERFDVLHAWLYHANVLGAVIGRCAGVPRIILTERDLGHLHRKKHKLAARGIYRLATHVTANAKAVADMLLKDRLARSQQVVVVPNGVVLALPVPSPADVARARQTLGLPAVGPLIASVGRLDPIKGHSYFVQAAAGVLVNFPGAVFAVAGDGQERQALERQARSLGLDSHIRFTGPIEDVATLLAGVDVFVLPSLSEGMSNSLMEAMAAARPVVATAVGGNCELIEHGRSGLLVPPADANALERAISSLLSDPTRATALGRAAKERIAPYSIDRMVDQYYRLYEQPLKSGVYSA